MLKVNVKGCKSRSLKAKIKSLTRFCLLRFLSPRVVDQMRLSIRVGAKVEDVGNCIWSDEPYRGRDFEIELRTRLHKKAGSRPRLTQRDMLITLCHELVHVKQWAKGEKYDHMKNENMVRFRGRRYDTTNKDYWEWPWEQEAYGLERSLYELWVMQKRRPKKK